MKYETLKRVMDIFLALFLGAIFFPVSLVVALAIKLESPDGPVFADIPNRVGKDGRLFQLHKFRSMIPDAHIRLRTDPTLKKLYEEYKK
ncbi:MAG: Undecaprenyl-phosphate galactose phosphotransferase, partial [Candidatus Amesbacteria bacterium GW2011_GWC2_47_8]